MLCWTDNAGIAMSYDMIPSAVHTNVGPPPIPKSEPDPKTCYPLEQFPSTSSRALRAGPLPSSISYPSILWTSFRAAELTMLLHEYADND